jgi:DNA-binding SARP family transcriptional activator
MRPRIAIRLFGRLSFQCDDKELLRHASRKAQEIFCYLVIHRRGPVPRDRLATLISKARTQTRSAKALRHALWQLNASLCPDRQPGMERVIRAEGDWVQFVIDESVSLDIAEFEAAAKNPECKAQAVALYADELLHGWDQDWCHEERERLRQIYLGTLDSLVEASESQRDAQPGVAYAMLALHNDPTRECTHRALMRLFWAQGDRKSAMLQYQRCKDALRTGLGVEPDDETQDLARRIRAGSAPERHVSESPAEERLTLLPSRRRPRRGNSNPLP